MSWKRCYFAFEKTLPLTSVARYFQSNTETDTNVVCSLLPSVRLCFIGTQLLVTHQRSSLYMKKSNEDLFNFQGLFVKIYRNVTAKFKDKKPVSTCSKLEIPKNIARWVKARHISFKVFEIIGLSSLTSESMRNTNKIAVCSCLDTYIPVHIRFVLLQITFYCEEYFL